MLFTLVCGLRPMRYLEIGTFQGGSSLVVSAAMTATKNRGRMLCVDPRPQIDPAHWALIEERAILIRGYSPDVLPQARDAAGGDFDLVFIDGDHTAKGVYRDAIGVLPFLQQGACMLFHDSHYPDVASGINRFASEQAGCLLDFGIITREATVEDDDATLHWGGLRLMRVLR